MELHDIDRPDGVSQIQLVGRLDLRGVQDVELKFSALTASRSRPAVVDLSKVEYIASLGIGLLVSSAHAVSARGHALVLFGATGEVDATLRRAGIDQAITMVATLDEALAAVGRA